MDFTPLRNNRDYRYLYAAQFITFLGTMVTFVALPYQVYTLTHSSLIVGMLGVAELAPLLCTAFIGGALADAVDRTRMVLFTELGLGTSCALLVINASLPHPHVWLIFVVSGIMAALSGLQRPSLDSMLPRLLPPSEIPAAAGLSALRGSICMIAGPALGGLLIGTVGLRLTFCVDLLSYVLSLLCYRKIRKLPPDESAQRPGWRSISEGFRYAKSRQELMGSYIVDFVAMILGMPLALFPAMSDLLGGPKILGVLYASPAGGALLASVLSRWNKHVHRHGLGIMIAASVWGVAIIAFGFCRTLIPALICLAIAGGADAFSGMYRMTLWNQTIPDSLRGRLAGIEMVSYMSGPLLGNAEAGLVAAPFGVKASIVSGGVLCVAGVLICGVLLPGFVRYDARNFEKVS